MISKKAKGNYNLNKTKKFFEGLGYQVVKAETTKMAWIKGRMIPIHTDIWASDLIAMDCEEIIFIQVKTNITDVSTAKAAFAKIIWPKSVKRYIVRWEERARKPLIYSYVEDVWTCLPAMREDIQK